jgi:hypothetical protein
VAAIVIAGGGIAGLEALVALREDLGPQPQIDLLEPAAEFVERQSAVAEPFGGGAPRRRRSDDGGKDRCAPRPAPVGSAPPMTGVSP